jgi:multimeric flavodoxin WrbA
VPVTVLALAGSQRRGGNTETLLDWCLDAAREAGAEVVRHRLCDLDLHGCRACEACHRTGVCIQKDDMELLYPHLRSADSIVLAAPVYFQGMPAVPKVMIDRCQPFWALKYVLNQQLVGSDRLPRLGAFLSCSGTTLSQAFTGSGLVMKVLWNVLQVTSIGDLLYPGVDARGDIKEQAGAQAAAEQMGRRLADATERKGK